MNSLENLVAMEIDHRYITDVIMTPSAIIAAIANRLLWRNQMYGYNVPCAFYKRMFGGYRGGKLTVDIYALTLPF